MLQAFIDDSESNTDDRRLVLAAYIHTAEGWIKFSDEWDEALHAEPRIESLHMVQAHGRQGELYGWSEKKRTRKLIRLAKVIRKHGPWSLDCYLSAAHHRELVGPKAPYGLSSPYFPLTFVLTMGVARLCYALGAHAPCDFVFDKQDNVSKHVLLFWDHIVSRQPKEWGRLINPSPIFRDKAGDPGFVALQAADMLAWHTRREYEGTYPREYEPMRDLLRPDPSYSLPIPNSMLDHWADGFGNIPGSETVLSRRDWDAAIEQIIAEGGLS